MRSAQHPDPRHTSSRYAPWIRVGGGGLAYDFVRQLFVDSADTIAIVFNVVIGPVLGGISMPSVLNVELFDQVGFEELFDLSTDPHELDNIVSAGGSVLGYMRARLEELRKCGRSGEGALLCP